MKNPIFLALLSALALPVQAQDFDPCVLTLTGLPLQTGNGLFRTYVGDFDGDGFLDVLWATAVPNPQVGSQELWRGTATGFRLLGWVGPPNFVSHTVDGAVRSYVGDFNGDGRADIFRSSVDPSGNQIWYGKPDGTFDVRTFPVLTAHPFHSADGSTQTYVGDFNGDGKADLLRGYADPNWNAIFYSLGTGFTDAFLVLTGHPLQGSGTQSYVADFNGDGKADLLRGFVDPNSNALWYSTGSGFTDTQLVLTGHPLQTNDGWTATYVADFNGDGRADVLRGFTDPNWNAVFYSTGSGFTDTQLVLTGHPLQGGGSRSYVADFNGDGRADVLRGYVDPSWNAIWFSTGSGFTDTQLTLTGHPLQSSDGWTRSYVGDFNKDGKPDVLRGHGDSRWNIICYFH